MKKNSIQYYQDIEARLLGETKPCNHNVLYDNYCHTWSCMPEVGCYGDEIHCRVCGRFVSKCGCGCCDGESGWSDRRRRKYNKKKQGVQL